MRGLATHITLYVYMSHAVREEAICRLVNTSDMITHRHRSGHQKLMRNDADLGPPPKPPSRIPYQLPPIQDLDEETIEILEARNYFSQAKKNI